MKIIIVTIILLISLSNVYSQDKMSQDVHKFLTYQGVKLFKEKNPVVANTNPEFFNWLGGNAVNWEDWSNSLFNLQNNDFPYMRGSMYVGALREDEEDVIDELCFPLSPGGRTISHFWDADGANGDNSPVPFSSLYNTENAYKKILKLWFGLYSEGIAVGHVLGQNSHWTMKVRFGQNGDGNLATAYNNIRNGNLNYLWVSKDKGYYGPCEEGENYTDINVGFYTFCKNKWGWSDDYIIQKEKIIIYETLGRIIHLLGDMGVPAHAHNEVHTDWDYYELNLNGIYNNDNYRITWNSNNVFNKGIVNVNALNNPLKGLAYLTNQSADRMPCHVGNPWQSGGSYTPGDNTWVDNPFVNGDLLFFYKNITPLYASITDVPLNAPLSFDLCTKIHKYTFPITIRSIAGFIDYFFKQTTYTIPDPQIQNIFQTPYCINQGTTGQIICNLTNNLNPYDYEWTWSSTTPVIPPLKSFQGYYNICDVSWHDVQPNIKGPDKWKLKVEVKKKGGSVIASTYFYPNFDPPPISGCPMLVVKDQDTNNFFDNNLLNKSQLPEYQGQFITDKYILKTKPGIFDDKIKLDIVETSIDSSIINRIKLYSVTHPLGTKLGITANNEIVYYDSASVIQNDIASLYDSDYGYTDITSDLQFHNQNRSNSLAQGDSLYHIFAEYKNQDIINPAIITYMDRGIRDPRYPGVKDNFSGNLFVNTPVGTSQFPFMRRENPDDVILPLTGKNLLGSVDSIHIAWDKSFKIDYAAIASLNYIDFSVSELPLVTAFHTSDGDVLQNLLYLDSGYSYVSPNAYLNLEFSISPSMVPQVKTDYVLEINGQVIFLGSNRMRSTKVTNPNQNTIPDKYTLSQNYPNPFNPVTKINFSIPKQGFVTLKIYDLLGREIRTLVNETKQPGNYSVDFNGSSLASGIYFYRLESNSFTSIKRMVLIK